MARGRLINNEKIIVNNYKLNFCSGGLLTSIVKLQLTRRRESELNNNEKIKIVAEPLQFHLLGQPKIQTVVRDFQV